jgi:transcriptional regulator of arginine metabolism
MPGDSDKRAERQRVILEILGSGVPVESQKDLVELLQERGITATQSSISRDLEDLGVVRIEGRYRLGTWDGFEEEDELVRVFAFVMKAETAGPHTTVMTTQPNAASMVATTLRNAAWPEVVGVLAEANTLFIATVSHNAQKLLFRRIRALLRDSHPTPRTRLDIGIME